VTRSWETGQPAIEIHEFEVEREFLYWRHFSVRNVWSLLMLCNCNITCDHIFFNENRSFSCNIEQHFLQVNGTCSFLSWQIQFKYMYKSELVNLRLIKWEITRNLTSYERFSKNDLFRFLLGFLQKKNILLNI
jgi:hypothetical protein